MLQKYPNLSKHTVVLDYIFALNLLSLQTFAAYLQTWMNSNLCYFLVEDHTCRLNVGRGTGCGHVNTERVRYIFLNTNTFHPHKAINSTEETHTVISIEAKKIPNCTFIFSTLKHIKYIRNFCCSTRQGNWS